MVTNVVIEAAPPARYASEFLAQLSLVAKENALMICGPAIMTNASGRISAKLIERSSRACPD